MLTLAASSYLAGAALDFGVSARALAVFVGAVMLVPAAAWALVLWKPGRRTAS